MCLIKIELSKITYSFQILFKLELKLLHTCVFLPFSLLKIPFSPSLEARTESLQKILIAFWAMEFQEFFLLTRILPRTKSSVNQEVGVF